MWNFFTDKLPLHHKQDDSEQKWPLPRQFAAKLKNIGLPFFQMQSLPILSIFVHPSLHFFYVVQRFKWLSQYTILLFGHFGCHENYMIFA